MQISITANDYTQTAILAAVKKQQVFADWRVESRNEQSTTLSFTKTKSSLTDKECERKFLQQLDDEQLREKLERDFGVVRNLLVSVALSPIIQKGE